MPWPAIRPPVLRRLRGALAVSLALAAPPLAAQSFNPAQREEIIGILREALRQDPSILRDAMAAAEKAEIQAREAATRQAIAQHAASLFRAPEDPVRGNPDGRITLVEFFDARCGYCKQLHPTMEQLLRRHRDVRLVLKDLPILGPNSMLASRALLAAQAQGKYADLYGALLSLREEPSEPVLRREAERVGIDWQRLKREMEEPAIARRLNANRALAEALNIQGTPALVIGETLIPGAVDLATLEKLVAEQRTKPGG